MPEVAKSVPEYIASLPPDQARAAKQVRAAIRKAVDRPEETISYQIPCLVLENGNRVYFGAWAKHIGMYPMNRLPAQLEKKAAPYRASAATLQFKYADEIPTDLITELVREKAK